METKVGSIVELIEGRFKEVADLDLDLSVFPIPKEESSQVKTNKEKSKEHGEVFTPLWLVDHMLNKVSKSKWKDPDRVTMDMCSGYGQFSIRMIRKKFKMLGPDFDLKHFLKVTHNFSELQYSSCYKLLYIFGTGINLYIGDSMKLPELDEKDRGIMYYSEDAGKWISITNEVKAIMPKGKYNPERCESFVKDLEQITGVTND